MKTGLDLQAWPALLAGVEAVGREVLDIYQRDFDVEIKADSSPLTEADMVSHHALAELLQELAPRGPIYSEGSDEIPYTSRQGWKRYWLIDPLDGTREFINKSGEFTLNVALIEDGVPVFGIVHAPALGISWWGQQGDGAGKNVGNQRSAIRVRTLPDPEQEPWKVVGSRSHGAAEFKGFCAKLPHNERVSMGSSMKLCLVAEGSADLYPRLAPICEWGTAAAQAIVIAAGGAVLDVHTLKPLRCNQQESVLNPWFIVCGQLDERWEKALQQSLKLEA